MSRFAWLSIVTVAIVVQSLNQPVSAVEPVGGADWPQWRGPNRDNVSTETGLLQEWGDNGPELEFQVKGMGGGYASVAVVGDRLYTTGNIQGTQHSIAVDLKDQKVLWSVPVTNEEPKHGYEGSRCTPTVDGDLLYVITSNGQITCQKTSDGSVVWTRNFSDWGGQMMSGWGFSECALVDGDNVLCTPGSQNAMIVCLNKKTGKEVWKSRMQDEGKQGAGYSSIVISNGGGTKQYVQLVGRGLIGVRASDGEHLWTYGRISNPVANIPTPVVSGDYIFTSTGYDEGGSALLQLSKFGAKGIKWEEKYYFPSKELQNHHGGMVLFNDHLYFGHGHNQGFPVCVELKTGKIVWGGGRQRGAGSGSAAITCADGNLIFRYQSGQVALIEATPEGYNLKSSFTPVVQERESWAQPVVSNGKLYLREQDTLMCYKLAGN